MAFFEAQEDLIVPSQKPDKLRNMAYLAEITSGPQKGTLFSLTEGKTLGRRRADYLVKDPNISSLHCRVEKDEGGRLVLVDQGSANGILVNAQPVKKIKLLAGLVFTLGDTSFKVNEIPDELMKTLDPTKSWRDLLPQIVEENPPTKQTSPQEIPFFKPALRLEFLQGPEAEVVRTLAFGPRSFGFGHLDICLEDPEAPEFAFEIAPDAGGSPLLTNKSGFRVLLNKSPVDRAILKDGDLVQVGRSIIKVSFV